MEISKTSGRGQKMGKKRSRLVSRVADDRPIGTAHKILSHPITSLEALWHGDASIKQF